MPAFAGAAGGGAGIADSRFAANGGSALRLNAGRSYFSIGSHRVDCNAWVEYAPRWPVRVVNRMPGASWMAW